MWITMMMLKKPMTMMTKGVQRTMCTMIIRRVRRIWMVVTMMMTSIMTVQMKEKEGVLVEERVPDYQDRITNLQTFPDMRADQGSSRTILHLLHNQADRADNSGQEA
jgi:hypothetical protein